ncbi:Conserved hypothetical protein [Oleispira antarctica RB-8]|uniref:DUF1287 domain-containing protein n=1 Tax=Oleispira antarctica RB-8 TaxID=698738 RepID=R4YP05_OLEAN|nr:Conserved hypothetical protein [Oleispira antarctica RB-8]
MIFKKLLLIGLILSSQYSFSQNFELDVVEAALERTNHNVRYDGRYLSIPYPNGDVPANIGVCTDVIVRTYRAIGTDLQQLVHEDMVANFEAYPSKRIWGLSRTDKNFDHRRVPNLQAFLSRHGEVLAVSDDASDYKAGNIVTWMLPGNLPHIGLITNKMSALTGNPMVVHNIGAGPKLDDVLFSYSITGHYRYIPAKYSDPRR